MPSTRRSRVFASVGGSTKRAGEPTVTTPALIEELHQRKQALKQAAGSPEERATIEIVALMFQSILTEDRIPASVRVWFARLQMPVLRVAVGEPDFFGTLEHPARQLIDRMGSCVMGFDASTRIIGDALETEIRRVVQVIEQYPETGRRVFQLVLVEFQKFLDTTSSPRTRPRASGSSLAQQVEQKETMAIQYTIELRQMLNDVPVRDEIRDSCSRSGPRCWPWPRCATVPQDEQTRVAEAGRLRPGLGGQRQAQPQRPRRGRSRTCRRC